MPTHSPVRRARQQFHSLVLALRDPTNTKANVLASMTDDWDWEPVEWNETDLYKVSPDPTLCGGGQWWSCRTAEQTYDKRPKKADVEQLLLTISYPDQTGRPPCQSPCSSVLNGQQSSWTIYQHKKTGQWGLFVSKQCRWECQDASITAMRRKPTGRRPV